MKNEVPIWEKSNLTLEEAAAYSGIGINKGSIIFFVGLTLPRYRFSKPSASLDMNLR